EKWFLVLIVGHVLCTPSLKWRCERSQLQWLIRMFAGTPEVGNCALLLERVELGKRLHLLCRSRWISASRRIMATTSQNEAAREPLVKLYASATRWSRSRPIRQWLAGGNVLPRINCRQFLEYCYPSVLQK